MRAEYRSGTMFAVGASIPLVVRLGGVPIAGALGLWVGQSLIVPMGLLTVSCVAGGALAGGGVFGGRWNCARFGMSFPVGLGGPLLTVANLGGLSERESFTGLCWVQRLSQKAIESGVQLKRIKNFGFSF